MMGLFLIVLPCDSESFYSFLVDSKLLYFLPWDLFKNFNQLLFLNSIFKCWRSECLFFKDFIYLFIYLFLERGEGREKERKRSINVSLPLVHPLLGTWPATQACALTGNQTGDPLVCKPVLNPLSHTTQGKNFNQFLVSDILGKCLHLLIWED